LKLTVKNTRRGFMQGGLSFGDGFKFGCGFQVAALLFGIGVSILVAIIFLVLSITGVSLLSVLSNMPTG
jgi:hypothetical protein